MYRLLQFNLDGNLKMINKYVNDIMLLLYYVNFGIKNV